MSTFTLPRQDAVTPRGPYAFEYWVQHSEQLCAIIRTTMLIPVNGQHSDKNNRSSPRYYCDCAYLHTNTLSG